MNLVFATSIIFHLSKILFVLLFIFLLLFTSCIDSIPIGAHISSLLAFSIEKEDQSV